MSSIGPVRVEPAAGLQGQTHRVEEARSDIVLADVDQLVAAGRDDAAIAVVVGIDADVGEARGDDAGDALHLLDETSTLGQQLGSAELLHLRGCGRA